MVLGADVEVERKRRSWKRSGGVILQRRRRRREEVASRGGEKRMVQRFLSPKEDYAKEAYVVGVRNVAGAQNWRPNKN